MPAPRVIAVGDRFGRFVVVGWAPPRRSRGGKSVRLLIVQCECGSEVKTIIARDLYSGHVRSCGCLRVETSRATGLLAVAHGAAVGGKVTREYRSFTAMIKRCDNTADEHWPNYGGRGIKVCERWRHDFVAFLSDMGPRPDGKTLDRFPDPNGNYEPGNCRWATPKEQQRNRRNNVIDAERAADIRRMATGGDRQAYIAHVFEISPSVVRDVIRGATWA